jgi:pimeloyl-ACP methyl ester carboxylesterase
MKRSLWLVVALVLAGCGAGPAKVAPPLPKPTSVQSYYHQQLAWSPCGTNSCATLAVPLDYANPTGKQIQLSVVKVAATGHKIGDLVVNPGGPGGSGFQFAVDGAGGFFREPIMQHYDLIGFDPRGVGKSTPISCGDTAQTDALVDANPDPETSAEWAQANTIAKTYFDRCKAQSGDLIGHVSTVEAARDMDILRAALGQPKLNYYGASYGTFLGATYAGLFPRKVGRMVLDGALDPALSTEQMTLQQAHSMDVAFRSYVSDCVSRSGCVLGSSLSEGVARVERLLAEVSTSPLPTGASRSLNGALALYGIWAPLYVHANWPQLTDALTEAITQHRGTKLLALADAYTGRGSKNYLDNSIAAQNAVNCLDRDDYVPWQQISALMPSFTKASPTFGKAFATLLASCEFYPVQTHHKTSAIRAVGAPPIVVIGTTRDPVTPLAWARALASQLQSGILVTRNGDGHTAYSEGNTCINNAVENYFVHGIVPRKNLAC